MLNNLIIFIFCTLLFACGGGHRTGAQKTPENGQLKGSQKPYTVLGRRYEPLRSAAGFSQSGIASWYGKDFHGKKTSNGETYDMHAMTAAHKTLPLGVYVKVYNRSNGKEITVRVNDRGPFVKGRIIDLSNAAAKKIGMDTIGTAPVRIEALGYKSGGGYSGGENYDKGSYTIQVGAFTVEENAQRLSAEMNKRYGFGDVRKGVVDGKTYYRVYAGKYSSLKQADAAERDAEKDGHPGSFVVSLD